MKQSFDKWNEVYKGYNLNQEGYLWPSETLIRIMKGRYIKGLDKKYEGKKVLDVGFGNGNNLVFLSTLGLKVFGTEVHPNICTLVEKKLSDVGHDVELKSGENTSLPFNDGFFDFLTSWNVIHYENTLENMVKAINEYSRVLKTGGRFFISTVAPDNSILKNAKKIDDNIYEIGREDDFRKGERYFYFETEENIHKLFQNEFEQIVIGRIKDELMVETLDFFIITGVKK